MGVNMKRIRLVALGALTVMSLAILELHLLDLNSNDFAHLWSSSDLPQEIPKAVQNYALKQYHHDWVNNLMIVSKTLISGESSEIGKNLEDFQYKLSSSDAKKYTFRLINGYDYTNLHHPLTVDELLSDSVYMDKLDQDANFLLHMKKFLGQIFAILHESRPSVPKLDIEGHYKAAVEENRYPNNRGRVALTGGHLREQYLDDLVRTEDYLLSFFRLTDEEKESLTGSHSKYLGLIPEKWPMELTEKYNKYNNFMKGDGIVFLVGGKYDQIALMGIERLRSVGSKLPIEVMLPHVSDFTNDYCNVILPALGAECKIMTDYIPEDVVKKVHGFQLKSLALLCTTFKNVLFLDADNMPVINPDILFVNKPFTNKGLVGWPDFWRRTASPAYYDIAGVEVNTKKKVRNSYFAGDSRGTNEATEKFSFHDCEGTIADPASEAGQLLINREMHFKTLLLMLYYNYFGPDYYYQLFSQGQTGVGDKDTFLLAAHALKLPYYQVKEFTREFGPMNQYEKQDIHAMGQYDPIIDYIQYNDDHELTKFEEDPFSTSEYSKEEILSVDLFDIKLYTGGEDDDYRYYGKPTYAKDKTQKGVSNYKYHYFTGSRLAFLHVNGPKFNLKELFLNNYGGRGPKDGEGKRRRLYGRQMISELRGEDVEKKMMYNAKHLFCELPNLKINLVPDWETEERKKICKEIYDQVDYLETPDSA